MRVLDIGCGNGAYTLDIARKADFVVGIDIEQERLKCAKKTAREQALKNIELILMSAENLSFPDNYFDLVTMIEVIEHIPEQDKALQNVRRVLKNDGRLVIFAPNKFFPFETHGAWFRGKKNTSCNSIFVLASQQCSFTICRCPDLHVQRNDEIIKR